MPTDICMVITRNGEEDERTFFEPEECDFKPELPEPETISGIIIRSFSKRNKFIADFTDALPMPNLIVLDIQGVLVRGLDLVMQTSPLEDVAASIVADIFIYSSDRRADDILTIADNGYYDVKNCCIVKVDCSELKYLRYSHPQFEGYCKIKVFEDNRGVWCDAEFSSEEMHNRRGKFASRKDFARQRGETIWQHLGMQSSQAKTALSQRISLKLTRRFESAIFFDWPN